MTEDETRRRPGPATAAASAAQRLSLRQVAERAGWRPGICLSVERGTTCPTIAMLGSYSVALGTDLKVLRPGETGTRGRVFRREAMACVTDERRTYTLVLPRREDVRIELLDEEFRPGEAPEFEELPSDLTGYVLDGQLLLEVSGEEPQVLRPGDAFYVEAGRAVRGCCAGDSPVRLVTVVAPPRY